MKFNFLFSMLSLLTLLCCVLCIGSESYCGALPTPNSILSRHYSMDARVLADKYLEPDPAYKLYDIAGDYAAMVNMLKSEVVNGSKEVCVYV